jgi:hypothetical protein
MEEDKNPIDFKSEYKQICWSDPVENIIKNIQDSCSEYKCINIEAARYANIKYDIVIYTVILLGTLSGILASTYDTSTNCSDGSGKMIQLFLALISAVLSAFIKFSKFEHQASTHKSISLKFASLENNIIRQLALSREDRQIPGKYLDWVSHSFDELFNSSPLIIESVYQKWKNSTEIKPELKPQLKPQVKPDFSEVTESTFSDGNMRYELERLRNN